MAKGGKVFFLGTFAKQHPRRTQNTHYNIQDLAKIIRLTKEVPKAGLTKILLVDVVRMDFRRSERTIFEQYVGSRKKKNYKWKENETFMAVNGAGTLALFFVGESRINNAVVLDTRKWRITGHGETWWNPDTLVYYAAQAGFDLILPGEETIQDVLRGAA